MTKKDWSEIDGRRTGHAFRQRRICRMDPCGSLAGARSDWTLLTKVETSCDRILIAGGANVEAEWEQGPAV